VPKNRFLTLWRNSPSNFEKNLNGFHKNYDSYKIKKCLFFTGSLDIIISEVPGSRDEQVENPWPIMLISHHRQVYGNTNPHLFTTFSIYNNII